MGFPPRSCGVDSSAATLGQSTLRAGPNAEPEAAGTGIPLARSRGLGGGVTNAPVMQKRLSAILADHRAGILEAWMRRVLDDPEVPEANRLPTPALRDHIPRLLDELIAALEPERPSRDEEAAGYRFGRTIFPVEHARQRVGAGYTLASALRELSHFRSVLLDFALGESPENQVDPVGIRLMHAALDECMAFSAAEMQREAHGALAVERALRERFIAVLAHDLRSPLSNVVMATELLLRAGVAGGARSFARAHLARRPAHRPHDRRSARLRRGAFGADRASPVAEPIFESSATTSWRASRPPTRIERSSSRRAETAMATGTPIGSPRCSPTWWGTRSITGRPTRP